MTTTWSKLTKRMEAALEALENEDRALCRTIVLRQPFFKRTAEAERFIEHVEKCVEDARANKGGRGTEYPSGGASRD